MNESEFDANLSRLRGQVAGLGPSRSNGFGFGGFGDSFLARIDVRSPTFYYVVLPASVFLFLLLWRPYFVMEVPAGGGESRTSLRRILVSTVMTTTVVAAILFAYCYRK